MYKKFGFLALATVIIFSFILSGCSGGSKPGNSLAPTRSQASSSSSPVQRRGITGTISTGKTVAVTSGLIDSTGGNITVSQPDSLIKGMELNVPSGSYKDQRDFKISYATIDKHSFGEAFSPITPLITIENGGEYADQFMELKIPVKVPDGYFAMGFLYDDKTKKLEGIPTIASDANSITLATRHFCSLVITDIEKAKLKKDIDSGFRPGIDDWQFNNWGSYIAPAGHCTGQCVTALWYYCTQPDGKGITLNGRYDNWGQQPATPNFWEDDSASYRFVSTVNKDIDFNSKFNNFWFALGGLNDEATWYMFAYSMQLTGEPQEIGIYSNAGGGHDLICYRISEGNLYIADPNYEGNLDRRIEWVDGKFKPYNSGANKEEIDAGNGKAYEKIAYWAKTTTIGWDKIAQRWGEFQDNRAGNDRFPEYKIVWKDDKDVVHELNDGLITSSELIDIYATSNQANVSINTYRDGVKLPWDEKGNYKLLPGNNKLGIAVFGKVAGKSQYIDFKYFNVIFAGLGIDPPTLNGEINKEYTFTAKMNNPPVNTRFSWTVDGAIAQNTTANTLKTTFKSEGTHALVVKALDGAGKEIGQAKSVVNIKSAAGFKLEDLQKMTSLKGNFEAQVSLKDWQASGQNNSQSTLNFNFPMVHQGAQSKLKIAWNGVSFSGSSTDAVDPNASHNVSGTVSADGLTLLTLTYKYQYKTTLPNSAGYTQDTLETITLGNVPLSKMVSDSGPGIGHWNDLLDFKAEATYRDTWYLKDKVFSEKTLTSVDKLTGAHFTFLP
jgi:hypothetical protein